MTNQPLQIPGSTKPSSPTNNPFARALAELENQQSTNGQSNGFGSDPFADALARTGGQYSNQFTDTANPLDSPYAQYNQADLLKKQQEEAQKARLKKELHDRINPVETTDIFNARREQVAKEIDQLREDLKKLAFEISKFHKEIDVTLMTAISDPGDQGKYYLNFFQKLRAFIMMLRQQVKSARTWMQQSNTKKAKKKRRGAAPGMMVEGNAHEQTQTIFDTMHHERSSTYGGS